LDEEVKFFLPIECKNFAIDDVDDGLDFSFLFDGDCD